MTAGHSRQFVSSSLKQTRDLGAAIGRLAEPGLVLALIGDLGCGKTSLVQGVARGLGAPDDCYVTSPTYTLMNEYLGRCPLIHVDLYRLDHLTDIFEIGLEEKLNGQAVVAIEWPEKLEDVLFDEYISVRMTFVNDRSRRIELIAYGPRALDLLNKLDNVNRS